jgi:hypothetical protein
MEDSKELFNKNELLNLFERSGIYQNDQYKKFSIDPVIVHGDTWYKFFFKEKFYFILGQIIFSLKKLKEKKNLIHYLIGI